MRQISSTSRFSIKKQLGEGSFSCVYLAHDNKLDMKCALKIEKADKPKRVLQFEYNVLKELQGLNHVCKIYDFAENEFKGAQSVIVMQLLGSNLTNHKRQTSKGLVASSAIPLLIQMLDSIEEIHARGYIHRDVKPSNFALGIDKNNSVVYIVDFGLSRKHLNNGEPIPPRPNTDFRGTVTFASFNAHIKEDLSRRDDIWSFYFVILDFLNEQLPWKSCKDGKVDEVKTIKERCLKQPEKYLWKTTKEYNQIKNIFYHLQSLKYEDKPDYSYIRSELHSILDRDFSLYTPLKLLNSNKKNMVGVKEETTSKKRVMKDKRKRLFNKNSNNFKNNKNNKDNKNINQKGSICKVLNRDESLGKIDEIGKKLVQGKHNINFNNELGNMIKDQNNANHFENEIGMNNYQPVDLNLNLNQNLNQKLQNFNFKNNINNMYPKNIQYFPYPGLINPMGQIGQINSFGQIGPLNQIRQMGGFNPINQINLSNNSNQMKEMKISQPIMPFYPNLMLMNSFPEGMNFSQNMYMPCFSYPSFSQNIININQLNPSNPFYMPTIPSIHQQYNQDFVSSRPKSDPKTPFQNYPVNNESLNMINKFNAKFLPKLNIPKENENQGNVKNMNSDIYKVNLVEEKIPKNPNNITDAIIPDINKAELKNE